MSRNIREYDLLISCPGDIQNEVELVEKVVADFNERYSSILGISIHPKYWYKSSYPQSGGKPQTLLNEQFIKKCDAAVAILWTRFGTPTDKYGSGTEEEIEIMLKAKKQVFMYFSDKPKSPSLHDSNEYSKVLKFKEKYKKLGIFWTFSSDEEFEKLFSAHLAQHFLSLKAIENTRQEEVSRLCLRGIDEKGKLCECVPIQQFKLNTKLNHKEYVKRINRLYEDIIKLNLIGTGQLSRVKKGDEILLSAIPSFYPPVNISKKQKAIITQIAKAFEICLPENFFDLGDLTENIFYSLTSQQGSMLQGTSNERRKYKLLSRLYDTIIEFLNWSPIEKSFSELKCIKLAIENSGTSIDEDVEISISFEKGILLELCDFPSLDTSSEEHLIENCSLETLFGIPHAIQYKQYQFTSDSKFPLNYFNSQQMRSSRLLDNENSEMYKSLLKNCFQYDIYSDEQHSVLKLNVDYIKHHTSIAFPTVIFVKKKPQIISYTITSKNVSDIIVGEIEVMDTTIDADI